MSLRQILERWKSQSILDSMGVAKPSANELGFEKCSMIALWKKCRTIKRCPAVRLRCHVPMQTSSLENDAQFDAQVNVHHFGTSTLRASFYERTLSYDFCFHVVRF